MHLPRPPSGYRSIIRGFGGGGVLVVVPDSVNQGQSVPESGRMSILGLCNNFGRRWDCVLADGEENVCKARMQSRERMRLARGVEDSGPKEADVVDGR